jgi:hypothetical protein
MQRIVDMYDQYPVEVVFNLRLLGKVSIPVLANNDEPALRPIEPPRLCKPKEALGLPFHTVTQ